MSIEKRGNYLSMKNRNAHEFLGNLYTVQGNAVIHLEKKFSGFLDISE